MEYVLKRIAGADAEQIDRILETAIQRKRELYPAWELVYYAQPKGEKVDMRYLERILGPSK